MLHIYRIKTGQQLASLFSTSVPGGDIYLFDKFTSVTTKTAWFCDVLGKVFPADVSIN